MRRWLVLSLAGIVRRLFGLIPRLGRAAWIVLDALLLIAGLALIVAGVAHWSTPAAYIVGGSALIALGVAPIRRRS